MAILSCAAFSASVYLVAAIDEAVDHQLSCGAQIVFDPDGTLIARHRQLSCDDGEENDDQYFIMKGTGLKIGLLLFEDVLEDDHVRLMTSDGVYHYALSFKNLNPNAFGTSLEILQWWSYSNNAVLIASGLARSAGFDRQSGIFTGRNNGKCLPQPEDRGLVIAEISSNLADPPVCLRANWHSIMGDEDHTPQANYNSLQEAIFLPVTEELDGKQTKLCQNDFCCEFYLQAIGSDAATTGFKLLVFSGVPSNVFGPLASLDQCGLITCNDCQPIKIVELSIVSNKPGLEPDIRTKGLNPTPKLSFIGGTKPMLSAVEDIDSVEWAGLQSVKYNYTTTESFTMVEEASQVNTEEGDLSSFNVDHDNKTSSSTLGVLLTSGKPDNIDNETSMTTPSVDKQDTSPIDEVSEHPQETIDSIYPATTGKREMDFMQHVSSMNSKVAENAKRIQENLTQSIKAIQERITAGMMSAIDASNFGINMTI